MLRIVGAGCIILGSVGIGLWYRQRLREGLWHLRCMQRALELFISEIRYGKATLPECCRQVGGRLEEPYGAAMRAVYADLTRQEKSGFGGVWREQMSLTLAEVPVTEEEKGIFLYIAESAGMADGQMQIRAIEQSRDMLADRIKNREGNLAKQERLACGLGIMGGLLLAVILL